MQDTPPSVQTWVRRLRIVPVAVALLTLLGMPGHSEADGVIERNPARRHAKLCDTAPSPLRVRCHAALDPNASPAPVGLSPATIKSVYGFPTSSTAGAGKTIAIVNAYDDPTAEADLAVFSQHYGLPACTTANGCFTKVNQSGGTAYPQPDSGWALETSLDVQWAHAIAPGAKILLVEANSNQYFDMFTAVNYAKQHATYVSMSWGGAESASESIWEPYLVQPGVSFFASSGDTGLPASYPSASPKVISVGGTTLNLDLTGNLISETGWSGSGGGCSVYMTATSAQAQFSQYPQVNCSGRRATPDVSLDADPASGVSVYDGTAFNGQTGWWQVGGTSAATPMWAARAAVAQAIIDSNYVYNQCAIAYRDITSGSNGASALAGFDLVTGRGSWTSVSSALPSGVLSGKVTRTDGTTPVAGAVVSIATTALTATTDAAGAYCIPNVPAGSYSISTSASGFLSASQPGVALSTGVITTNNVALTGIAGGKNLKISAGTPQLTWDTGTTQAGYLILRLDIYGGTNKIFPTSGGVLPANTTTFTDTTGVNGAIYCYVVLPLSPVGASLGLSDVECMLSGLKSGPAVPGNFNLSLHQSSTATFGWDTPAGGADAYVLAIVPMSGSSSSYVTLPGTATGTVQPISGNAFTCYFLIAQKGAVNSTTDALCAIPGYASIMSSGEPLQLLTDDTAESPADAPALSSLLLQVTSQVLSEAGNPAGVSLGDLPSGILHATPIPE